MKNLSNIEPSYFHKGRYVGYCDGVWKIHKMQVSSNLASRKKVSRWMASKVDGKPQVRFAPTLEELNKWFIENNRSLT